MEDPKALKISMKVDGEVVFELSPTVTQKSIIDTINNVKQKLMKYNTDASKIHDVYDISVEMLQNILKYSYGNTVYEDNTRKADGFFKLKYNTQTREIILEGSNLVTQEQMDRLKERESEVMHLDRKELRKLLREKARSRKDGHQHGAGLGLATIAMRANRIDMSFEPILPNIYKYILEVSL